MRLFLYVLVGGIAFQLFLPWWVSALVAFALAFALAKNGLQAFVAGFAGIGLGWLLYSLFFHWRNAGLLTEKMGILFQLPQSWLLLPLGLLLGGLVGGTAALAGLYCRRLA